MKSKPETLVILTPAFPASEDELNWVPSQQLLVKALKSAFPEMNFIVLSLLYPYSSIRYRWHGMEVVGFNGMQFRKWRRPLLWRQVFKELNAIRRSNNVIGLFSCWCGEEAFIAQYYSRLYAVPHRSWISGQDARETNKWVRFIRPRAGDLAAMSPFLSFTFYKNHGITPGHIIPNAIDPAAFPSPPPPEKRDLDILGVGSLIPLKQYDLLVQAVAALTKRLPAIKARHTGDGDEKERERLMEMIGNMQLKDNLLLLGEQRHPDTLRLMQRTKILLHPSSYEGFSTVCLEALYAGAHVISFWDPMDKKVAQWHIVKTLDEMIEVAFSILHDPATEYRPTLLYDMEDTAVSIMRLFQPNATGKRAAGSYV